MKFYQSESTAHRTLILLAPDNACLQPFFGKITFSAQLHADLTARMQRLRGRVYVDDGAIPSSDLSGERHVSPLDARSWHLLILDACGEVLGCTRFRRHHNRVSPQDLAVSRAPIARCDIWGDRFRASIDSELDVAREAGFAYVEIGGWALAPEVRCTSEALRSVLATYALAQVQGGAVGISTATTRNGSAGILRRLGGQPLEWLGNTIPAYYDENYGCTMEILRFDSRCPSPRFAPMIRELRSLMVRMPVVYPGEDVSRWSILSHGFFGAPAVRPDATALPAMA